MDAKQEPCKGTGLAKGYGCGKNTFHRVYGLGKMCCYADWLLNSENGKIKLEKARLKATKPRRDLQELKEEKKNRNNLTSVLESTKQVFHQYVRLRDKGKPCISCQIPWHSDFQAGHFYKAELFSTIKFHEFNVNGQCVQCNIRRDGNESEYRIHLPDRIGKIAFDIINSLAIEDHKTNHKWDRSILIELRDHYRKEYNKLKQ